MTMQEAWAFLDGPPVGHRRDLRARAEALKALAGWVDVSPQSGTADKAPPLIANADERLPQ